MSRLVDDPTKVGPGTYLISEEAVKKSPKSTINWQNSRSMRSGVWASNMTQPTVGPGSYTQSNMHYKPMQPFFPRTGATKKQQTRNTKGSIRDNYDEPDSDEEEGKISPGPGHYLSNGHDSSFRLRNRPQSLQFFGSNVKRFDEKPVGC